MITMNCDNCGRKIDASTNGGCRLRTSNRELSFHLCAEHQEELRTLVKKFCAAHQTRDVSPSLSFR